MWVFGFVVMLLFCCFFIYLRPFESFVWFSRGGLCGRLLFVCLELFGFTLFLVVLCLAGFPLLVCLFWV